MKLAIYFNIDRAPFVVDWDKNLTDFPHNFIYDGKYWQWTMHDTDGKYFGAFAALNVQYHLLYGEIHENGIPTDILGNRYPVPDFKLTFGFTYSVKKCECGAEKVYGPNTGHATWCPMWSKV